MRRPLLWLAAPLLCVVIASPEALAVPAAADLLPIETVGCVTIDNAPDFLDRWGRTQLGLLAEDPLMRPFRDQLVQRFNGKFGGIEERLGVTLDDLRSVASGEAAIALVSSTNKQQPGRIAAVIDTTGRDAEVAAVLAKVDARMVERGAQKSEANGVTVYRLAEDKKAGLPKRTAAVFHAADRLGVAEGERLAGEVLARVRGENAGETLSQRPAYIETQKRASQAARGAATHVRWFIAPFEYERAARPATKPSDLAEKKPMMDILAEQGFDAVRGLGGLVSVAASPDRDFVHYTFASAPGKPGTEGRSAAEKYDLAMRMLELPNDAEPLSGTAPPVELWAPRQVATYKLVHLDLQNAFRHFDTLFDSAIAGYSDAFEKMLAGFEKDPYGPKIKIREEVVPYLGERVVVMTDYTLPITPECERYLIAIDVTDQEALRAPIDRWLESDGAEKKELEGVPYWEMVPEQQARVDDSELDLLPLDEPVKPVRKAKADRDERVLRRAAVCLHRGRLVIGSDADFLRQALFGVSPGDSLAESADLRAAVDSLSSLAPGERCAWNFTRNDESLRPTYELLRAGRMPEAETFFGRLMNRLLTTDEEKEFGAMREQKIDGSKLPSFELARRYFGPSARSVRSEGDGWTITGVVLSKAAPSETFGPVAQAGR